MSDILKKLLTRVDLLCERKRRLPLLVLLAFCMQAMFAQGTMAGSGSWVELCSANTASAKIIYLSDMPEGTHQAADAQDCLFSASVSASSDAGFASLVLGASPQRLVVPNSRSLSGVLSSARARAPPLS